MRSSVYIVCPSVLSSSDLKLHQTLEVNNIFKQENIMLQLTFNPGLTLIGFRTTRPRTITEKIHVSNVQKINMGKKKLYKCSWLFSLLYLNTNCKNITRQDQLNNSPAIRPIQVTRLHWIINTTYSYTINSVWRKQIANGSILQIKYLSHSRTSR